VVTHAVKVLGTVGGAGLFEVIKEEEHKLDFS
jgi:hypothetical protein